jgi:plastocyanin
MALRTVGVGTALVAATALSACGADDNADVVAGKKLFVQKCGSCHTLARAGTKGTTGPNLDQAFMRAKQDGFGGDSIEGVVRQQIRHPSKNGQSASAAAGVSGAGIMPANLVTGANVNDVAGYVASAVAEPGKDTGLLASAVPAPGAGKTVAAKGGVLPISADASGQLAFNTKQASAAAGQLDVAFTNSSGVPHDVVIDGKGRTKVIPKGNSDFKADFAPGTYTFYCSVPGHREAGMQGKLVVK